MTRMVLFTETNSVFGSYFLTRLARHDDVILAAVVLREPGALCDYYLDEPEPLDLAKDAAELDVHTLRPAHINTDEFITAIVPGAGLLHRRQLPAAARAATPRGSELRRPQLPPQPVALLCGAGTVLLDGREPRDPGRSLRSANDSWARRASSPSNSSRSPGRDGQEIRDMHFAASWRLFDLVLPTLLGPYHLGSRPEQAHLLRPPARRGFAGVSRMTAHRRTGLVATLLGFFIVMLDTTIVNVALAEIGTDLDTTVGSLQWVVDAYTLVFAAFLLTAGAHATVSRRVYLAGLVVFAVLSAVCALAPTGGFLVAGRAVQGWARQRSCRALWHCCRLCTTIRRNEHAPSGCGAAQEVLPPRSDGPGRSAGVDDRVAGGVLGQPPHRRYRLSAHLVGNSRAHGQSRETGTYPDRCSPCSRWWQ